MGLIFDIKKFSIHDGPGIRTTIFLKGCPLHCWWCHNPESQRIKPEMMLRENRCIACGDCVEACPEQVIFQQNGVIVTNREACVHCGACVDGCFAEARELIGREMSVAEVMAEIERDLSFYDESGGGVTFSGGEPLLQRDFLQALLQNCRKEEIHTAVDTSGFAAWESFERIREYVDVFLYDLKLMDDAKHQKFTGVSNKIILQNLQSLSQKGHNIILRLTIIPGINDDAENLRRTAEFAAALPHIQSIAVLPYHNTAMDKYQRLGKAYRLPETKIPANDRIATIAASLRSFGAPVTVGG